MTLLTPIGTEKFKFYIVIYFFILFMTVFFLFIFGIVGYPTIYNINSDIILIISGILLICLLLVLLFKRLIGIKYNILIFFLIYVFPLILSLFMKYYIGDINSVFILIYLYLFNPLFPIILILLLSFRKGQLKEDFNFQLITHKIFGALFFTNILKEKISNNKFLVGIYKYFFFILLFGIFIIFNDEQDRLLKYSGYEEYNSRYELKSDLYEKYKKENKVIIQYKEYDNDYLKDTIGSFNKSLRRNDENYSNPISNEDYSIQVKEIKDYVKLEITLLRNGMHNEYYIVLILYYLIGFYLVKIIPILLYFIKVPLSIIYLFIKKTFSKLEEVESNLKK